MCMCTYIYIYTHIHMDHQCEVSLQTSTALESLERWSTCYVLPCEAKQQMPQNLEARHWPVALGSFKNHGMFSYGFIHSYTFTIWICICIYIYTYIHESSSSYATCEGRDVFARLVTGDLRCL